MRQCPFCRGKASPRLGPRGSASNCVWGFVNDAAKEAAGTHPDKKVSCGAYGIYSVPPDNLHTPEPNVQVILVGGRSPFNHRPEDREAVRKLREAWLQKTDHPIVVFENYPFTSHGFYLPAYIPHMPGESINETKGVSRGEDIWLSMDFGRNAVGLNQFPVCVTARKYGGGKNQDAGARFAEYCPLFSGPAEKQMRAFFLDCEKNRRETDHDLRKATCALRLFAAVEAAAPAGTRSFHVKTKFA